MAGVDIDWLRWFVFAVLGLPLLVWLVATRNGPLRVIAVLAVVIFVQDTFVWRRYIVAVGVGPALILCYVAVMGLYLQQGRFARLGVAGALWGMFLAAALIGVIVGSVGTGLLFFNINLFQEFYLEGLLFFVLGMMALRDDDEVLRFFFWYALVIGFGVTVLHMFELLTGWRPATVQLAYSQGLAGEGKIVNPGGVFPNPNTLGSYYVMTIPVVLLQVLRGGFGGWRRAALGVALVLMTMSLGLTTARGGMLFTTLVCGYGLVLAGFSVGRVVGAGAALAALVAAAWLSAGVLVPEVRERITLQLEEEGLKTGRFDTWMTFATIAVENPLGLGLEATTIKAVSKLHGTTLGSAHNTFIDRAVKTGVFGLFAFLALIGHVVMRNLRALQRSRHDPTKHRALVYLLLPIVGFMAAGMVS
jgi:O-antigen ligase